LLRPFYHTTHIKLGFFITVVVPVSPAFAVDGRVQIREPSTIVVFGDKFYTYGTGDASLVSDDG